MEKRSTWFNPWLSICSTSSLDQRASPYLRAKRLQLTVVICESLRLTSIALSNSGKLIAKVYSLWITITSIRRSDLSKRLFRTENFPRFKGITNNQCSIHRLVRRCTKEHPCRTLQILRKDILILKSMKVLSIIRACLVYHKIIWTLKMRIITVLLLCRWILITGKAREVAEAVLQILHCHHWQHQIWTILVIRDSNLNRMSSMLN